MSNPQEESNSNSPIVKALQRHFRRLRPDSEQNNKFKLEEHAPAGLSNPFWNSPDYKQESS